MGWGFLEYIISDSATCSSVPLFDIDRIIVAYLTNVYIMNSIFVTGMLLGANVY